MAERGKYKKPSHPSPSPDSKRPSRASAITNVLKDESFGQKQWREGLRSQSPSPTRSQHDKRTTFSVSGKSMDTSNGFMDSYHSQQLNRSTGTTTIHLEQEYIKSLQQQVYLLELENNHLRQQVIKATEMHPNMTQEAQNMVSKLKDMQYRIDGLELELYRKDGNIEVLNDRITQLTNKLKQETENQSKEKEALLMESVEMRKKKDLLERDVARHEMLLNELRDDLNLAQSNLKSSESRVEVLRTKLDKEMDTNKSLELLLSDKRAELVKLENRLRELEERYYTQADHLQTQAKGKLQDELRILQEKLKDLEMTSENEKYLRDKLSRESAQLVKENAHLNQQIMDLQRQIEKEKTSRGSLDDRRKREMSELIIMKEHEKELQSEISALRRELSLEKQRADRLRLQIDKQEKIESFQNLSSSSSKRQQQTFDSTLPHSFSEEHSIKRTATTPSRLQGDDELNHLMEANLKLRRDKEYLIDHIENLQKQIHEKEQDISGMQSNMKQLEERMLQLERLKTMEGSLQSKRWEEMEKLADSLKTHAHLMAETASPNLHRAKSERIPEAY